MRCSQCGRQGPKRFAVLCTDCEDKHKELRVAALRVLSAGGLWLGDMTALAAKDQHANEFMSAMEALSKLLAEEP